MERNENYLTSDGLFKLETELQELTGDRRVEVATQIKKAAEVGGTVDNAEYNESPIGKVLLGRKVGADVEARTPVGMVKLKICQIG